jgi:phytoene dehydrogenase-like protein
MYPDGRYLMMCDDPARRHAQIAKFSRRDADEMERWDAWLGRLGAVLGPLLTTVPPRIGRKRPADLMAALGVAWKLRKLDERGVADLTRLMTMSEADLLEERFESDALRGVLSVSGVIGTWAGPRSPGTGYVMAHHKIGTVDGAPVGSWGFPRGGMGGVTSAMRDAAVAFGAVVRTDAPVVTIKVRDGRAEGVVLAGGEELDADAIVTTTHPQLTFLQLIDRAALPADFVTDIERWKSRSGTVKVNLALDRLPEFRAKPGFDPEVHGGTLVLANSLDEVEGAFQDAVAGRAARVPFADICIPSVFDPTLAPPGKHVMSMFVQYAPYKLKEGNWDTAKEAFADRCVDLVNEYAPNFKKSVLHRQVLSPVDLEKTFNLTGGNIFQGSMSLHQLFLFRPVPGHSNYRTPVKGLYLCGAAAHPGGGVMGISGMHAAAEMLKR